MGYTLVLGRDLNHDQTDVGPEVIELLQAGIKHQRKTGDTLVVAPGYSPDFPHQPRPYSAMMADWLRANGATKVYELVSDHFSTFGELEIFCETYGGGSVIGFDWHLKRAKMLAEHVPGSHHWPTYLKWEPVYKPMNTFDRIMEPLKRLNARLPPTWQRRLVRLFKLLVSRRTSY